MDVLGDIQAMREELVTWRRDIHAHPETAFEEHRTSDLVAERLAAFGLEVHRGLAGTGVVGTLTNGSEANGNGRAIGLRADMDALFLREENDFAHRSQNVGKDACLRARRPHHHALGCRQVSRREPPFRRHRALHLPAGRGDRRCRVRRQSHGPRRPVREVPGRGRVRHAQLPGDSTRSLRGARGADAGLDRYLRVQGVERAQPSGLAVHFARSDPHRGAHRRGVPQLQGARYQPGRASDHEHHAVPVPRSDQRPAGVHITPEHAYVRGTVYTLNDAVRDIFEKRLKEIAEGTARANGAGCEFAYERGYPVLVNTQHEKDFAVATATELVGADRVESDMQPIMGAEDFAFMLKDQPGYYVFIGNGDGEGSCHVHNPKYDFNDEALPFGVGYWVKLVERFLPASG